MSINKVLAFVGWLACVGMLILGVGQLDDDMFMKMHSIGSVLIFFGTIIYAKWFDPIKNSYEDLGLFLFFACGFWSVIMMFIAIGAPLYLTGKYAVSWINKGKK